MSCRSPAYDANGNRTQLTDNGAGTAYQYAAGSNRLTQVGADTRTRDGR